MSGSVREFAGRRVLVCADEGEPLAVAADAGTFLGGAWAADADWIAVPLSRLGPDFLTLRSGVAGEVVQKFVNYRVGFAVVGDLSPWLTGSESLRDFVREANRGRRTWFVADLAELERRLAVSAAAPSSFPRSETVLP